MAKQLVTMACGHEEEVTLNGSYKSRESRIEYLENHGECKACYQADIDRRNKEAAEKSTDLPALTGSDKQIAWAITIRLAKITALDEMIEKSPNAKSGAKYEAFMAIADNMKNKTEAKFWIDNREESVMSLLNICR